MVVGRLGNPFNVEAMESGILVPKVFAKAGSKMMAGAAIAWTGSASQKATYCQAFSVSTIDNFLPFAL